MDWTAVTPQNRVDFVLVQAVDQYVAERQQCPAAAESVFLLVTRSSDRLPGRSLSWQRRT